jgi:hypothetical protein
MPVLIQPGRFGVVPNAPTALSATLSGDDVNLDWDAPVIVGSSPITDYHIDYAPLTAFTDDFNRANGELGANWAPRSGWTALEINSNRVRATAASATPCVEDYASGMPSADGYAELTVNLTDDSFVGLLMRGIPGIRNEVGFEINADNAYEIVEFINDSHIVRATSANGAAATGVDLHLRGELEGSAARLYVDGALVLSATLTTHITGGTRIGFGCTEMGATATTRFDDFQVGLLAPATWTSYSESTSTATALTVTGLPDGEYYFRVRAVNAYGASAWSSMSGRVKIGGPTAVVPSAPTGVSGTPGNNQVALTWTPGSNGGSAISDWQVRYSTDNSTWTTFSDSVSATVGITVTGLTNGQNYYFQVRGVNAIGDGAWSTSYQAMAGLMVVPPLDNFTRADNASLGFPWLVRNTGTTTNMRITSNQATYGASTQDSTMQYGNYVHEDAGFVQARIRCDDGFAGLQAFITLPFRNEIEIAIRPADIALVEHNNGTEVVLDTATSPTDAEHLIRMEWEVVGGTTNLRGYVDSVLVLEGSTTNHITPGGVGMSSYRMSGTLYFDDFAAGDLVPIAPPAPTGLTLTPGNTQIGATINAVVAYPTVTDYVWQRSPAGANTWTTLSEGTNTATGVTFTGLTNGSSYDIRVAAVNSVGQGAWSSIVSATPVAPTGGPPPTISGSTTNEWTATTIPFSIAGTGATAGDRVLFFLSAEDQAGVVVSSVPTGVTRVSGVAVNAAADAHDPTTGANFKLWAFECLLASGFSSTFNFVMSTGVYANMGAIVFNGDCDLTIDSVMWEAKDGGAERLKAVTLDANEIALGFCCSYENGRANSVTNWTAVTGSARGNFVRTTTLGTDGAANFNDPNWASMVVVAAGS